MSPLLRLAFLAYFLALAPSIVILTSFTLPTPHDHDTADLPTFWKRQTDGNDKSRSNQRLLTKRRKLRQNSSNETRVPSQSTTTEDVNTFAACLLVMDDNAILPEFLAYHYLRLPLRKLIVAVDPRSETSPVEILNRYTSRGLMDITVWNDDDFMPSNHEEIRQKLEKGLRERGELIEDPLVNLHRDRQSYFISKCFNTLRRQGAKWVIHIDTDEYILPNYYAFPPYKLDVDSIHSNKTAAPPTIYEMIQSVKHIDGHLGSACISLPRVRIGTRESLPSEVDAGMPRELMDDINATNLSTFRWRWRNKFVTGLKSNGRAKAMVDVSRISKRSRRRNVVEHNPHRPVEKECLVRNMYLDARNSTFLVHHYASTWEQWTARKQDARQTTESNGRTREAWEKLKFLSVRQTDHIRPWLQDFVNVYGADLAIYLLKGARELSSNVKVDAS
jgi:hypothetical protein